MKNIIVACGSGVATSQLVASRLQILLNENNVNANVEAVDIKAIDTYISTADAFVSIVGSDLDVSIPTFNGIAFLTGNGEEEELRKIIDFING